jgi:hypothetical protein
MATIIKDTSMYDANGNLLSGNLYDTTTGTGAGHIADIPEDYASADSKRAEIIDYMMMRLADGIVDVEIDRAHCEMAIKQSMIKYRQRSSNGVEDSYAFLKLLPETQEYLLPREIMDIRAVYRRGISSLSGTSATQFEPFSAGYLNTYMLQAGRVGGLVNYELYASYQKLAAKMFGGNMDYTWNRATRKLTVVRKMPFQGVGQQVVEDAESILIWCKNYKPDWMLLNDHMIFPWVQEYAYSFAKRILGEARSKFASIAGPSGGTQLNGTALIAEAKEEIEQLEEEIKRYMDGSMPLYWVTG